eukprot:CAMPEP_0177352216 /NCGR_PEP_ID=MMETSP0368-20130122/32235_1 /TAXON_ID=447022 ORGANISM="Scrippsiella hangoei-like, Strain SHHI-4" /NCGR_SAMPLE_ID=MMETSP0368 /ASSEMBLY_ACC=CAM_ASM_000363 /LENGTH=227 /DNA_ID=CAMNT_0018814189 /DNA_START=39 /DNA_END=722 /DNA_ORIENTATION=-
MAATSDPQGKVLAITTVIQQLDATSSDGEKNEAVAIDQPQFNAGSRGHPELCNRPCLYFPVGQCTNKDACGFCHQGHPSRPKALDKRSRELLRSLSAEQCAALFLPIVRQKVSNIDSSLEAMRLVDGLAPQKSTGAGDSPVDLASAEVAKGEGPKSPRSTASKRNNTSIQAALKKMGLRSLVSCYQRGLSGPAGEDLDPSDRDAGAVLLRFLQEKVLVKQAVAEPYQ